MPADPYRVWLGIPKGVKHPSFYPLLGIAQGESSLDLIRSEIEQRRGYIRSKLGQGDDAAVRQILALIDEASATLAIAKPHHPNPVIQP